METSDQPHTLDTLHVGKRHSKYPQHERMDGSQSQPLQGKIPPFFKQNSMHKNLTHKKECLFKLSLYLVFNFCGSSQVSLKSNSLIVRHSTVYTSMPPCPREVTNEDLRTYTNVNEVCVTLFKTIYNLQRECELLPNLISDPNLPQHQ